MMNVVYFLDFCLKKKLGQRGAELVEYAIVLACIAAVGVYFYSSAPPKGTSAQKFSVVLGNLWSYIMGAVKNAH